MIAIVLALTFLAPFSSEAITIDFSPITNGYEVSLKEWYGESAFSLKVEKPAKKSDDAKCSVIISSVKAALLFKKVQGVLTEEQMERALNHFEMCWPGLCRNPAMIDKFQIPDTFKEQLDILIAKAKMGEWTKKKEKTKILRYLLDAKYRDIYAGLPFPPTMDEKTKDDVAEATSHVVESVCSNFPDSTKLKQNDVHITALYCLVDKYVADAVTEIDVFNLTKPSTPDEPQLVWERIAERILAPTSNFATTCLDPAVAYYNYERPSVARVKELASSMGINCGFDVEASGEMSGEKLDIEASSDMSGSGDGIVYETLAAQEVQATFSPIGPPTASLDSGALPPSSGPSSDSGPPSHSSDSGPPSFNGAPAGPPSSGP